MEGEEEEEAAAVVVATAAAAMVEEAAEEAEEAEEVAAVAVVASQVCLSSPAVRIWAQMILDSTVLDLCRSSYTSGFTLHFLPRVTPASAAVESVPSHGRLGQSL